MFKIIDEYDYFNDDHGKTMLMFIPGTTIEMKIHCRRMGDKIYKQIYLYTKDGNRTENMECVMYSIIQLHPIVVYTLASTSNTLAIVIPNSKEHDKWEKLSEEGGVCSYYMNIKETISV